MTNWKSLRNLHSPLVQMVLLTLRVTVVQCSLKMMIVSVTTRPCGQNVTQYISGVTVAWDSQSYNGIEGAGPFEACVEVTAGTLCRDIEVTISTADSASGPLATSKIYLH